MAQSIIEPDYRPADDEPFMSERQRAYFKRKLASWKGEILKEAQGTLMTLQSENPNHPDFADRASSETDRAIELRARDRQRKLISKIDAALSRIDEGTYGYCEDTGEPISLRRLEARPIATLSIEAQERHERNERVHRDDWGVTVARGDAQGSLLDPNEAVIDLPDTSRRIRAIVGSSFGNLVEWYDWAADPRPTALTMLQKRPTYLPGTETE